MGFKNVKLQTLFGAILSMLIFWGPFSSAPAYAQQDIGDILEDIFKTGELPAPKENEAEPYQFGRIDNIPVEIRYDVGEDGLPADAMLILSAYAPAPSNVRRSAPLLLGETRLLLTGLTSPLQVIIATPSAITQDLTYARIEARVIDAQENIILSLKSPGSYDGNDAPILVLTSSEHSAATLPEAPKLPPEEFEVETLRGRVRLNGKAPKFRGSNLIVRLTEDGLAGGNSQTVLGELRQILDGKAAPFSFEFERAIDPVHTGMPLTLEVWIEDWAGRKTHVTPAPLTYTGPSTRYRIRLDAIGPQVRNRMPKLPPPPKTVKQPKPQTKPKPVIAGQPAKPQTKPKLKAKPKTKPGIKSLPARQSVSGKAKFNAFKGLPKGSVLIASLERSGSARPSILAQTRVPLDGLSGYIDFKINTKKLDLSPNLKTPVLRVRIQSKDGKLFFSNPGGTRLKQGFNTVTLKASPNY
ncbi:MAG: hypothetical protein JKY25_05415 [Robiginitomaculum sp.]|nr:hypothetical protein [Robiginitomaculum sp.]